MTGYAQHLTNAIAVVAKNTWTATLAPATERQADRPRPVSEVLDLRRTFVAGYPRHIEADGAEGR
jgi:hypothetical protein